MKNTEEAKTELAKSHPNDPLHGKTLKFVVEFLFAKYGWERLGQIIKIKCFNENPSVKSSLTFLRKTDWARKQVEDLYVSIANPREMRER
jgi:uncharacterized protein (DUF2132 family)